MIFFCIVVGYGYREWQAFHMPRLQAQAVRVFIPKKSTLEKISQILEQHRVIRSALLFQGIARLKGWGASLKAGEYVFPALRSPASVLQQLYDGKTVQHFVTFPEGLSSAEMVAILRAAPFLEGEILEIPAEGTLLPETYAYSFGDDRQSLLNRLQKAMQDCLHQLWQGRQPGLPFTTPQEALTLASIVEKETAKPEERPRIAAVFINRLNQGMPLQSDPTVIYALKQIHQQPLGRDLTAVDLQIVHPYNTYQIKALPPGPICNPGVASLYAVLHPMDTQDLFFVADGSGGHTFSQTFNEHQRKHQTWRHLRKQHQSQGKIQQTHEPIIHKETTTQRDNQKKNQKKHKKPRPYKGPLM